MIHENSALQVDNVVLTPGFGRDRAPSLGTVRHGGTDSMFPAQFDGTVRRLRGNRLRFSVMRLILPADPGDAADAARVAAHMADPHVMAGLWHDESVVAAFFGPRSRGSAGDQLQTGMIVQRCRRAMTEAGKAELIPFSRLLITHCWTDQIIDPAGLIEALDAPSDRCA
jgi:hypothetical protein